MSISSLLVSALFQTVLMTFSSGVFAMLLGFPCGLVLHVCRPGGLMPHRWVYRLMNSCVDALRSIPFIILIVAVIPLTRLIMGTSVGTFAAIVPLTMGAAPFVARIVANALDELPPGLIEAGKSMGATHAQIVRSILLAQALPSLIKGMTLMLVTLVAYSAMAGAVGAGGLGEVAIDYGYQRFDTSIMVSTVLILILLVQCIQYVGDYLARKYSR